MKGHIVVFSGNRVCLFLRMYYWRSHVLYMCVRGYRVLHLFLLYLNCSNSVVFLVFRLMSVTSTCIMNDIGGRGFDVDTYCTEATKNPLN